MIYLDNAATSWPKPPEVARAMGDFLERAGGNPGRAGHRLSIAAARAISDVRETLAALFHAPDPLRIVFTPSVTQAINLALRGLVRLGDRVVTTGMEHNAVMRPLRALEEGRVHLTVVPCRPDGELDLLALRQAVIPSVRLVVVAHADNVTGALRPLDEIARIAHDAGAPLLVDAAQTAGAVPIDVQDLGIDLLAFTGHKGLLGPPGTGGLILGERVEARELRPLVRGGTGSHSEHEEQPEELPDKFESGTPNGPGLAGLGAGVRAVMQRGVEAIRAHEAALTAGLLEGLAAIPGVRVYGPPGAGGRTAVISFTAAGRSVSELALRLEEEYQILGRAGLHCAPAAHRTLGTFPDGTVRLAPGPSTTRDEIQATLRAVERIVRP